MALLNEINVKGVPHPIVTDDGYYQEMTVGDAEQLVATTFTEDDAPYNFRTAGDAIDIGDRKQVEGLVGGTIAWNQLARWDNAAVTANGVTVTPNSDGSITLNGTATSGGVLKSMNAFPVISGHKYLFMVVGSTLYNGYTSVGGSVAFNACIRNCEQSSNTSNYAVHSDNGATYDNVKLWFNAFDLTQMFGSAIADYIYSLEQANAGAGVAWFKKRFPKPYYTYNAGQLMSVKALRHITRGFNILNGNFVKGYYGTDGEPVTDNTGQRWRIDGFIPIVPNTTYYNKMPDGFTSATASAGFRFYDASENLIESRSANNGTFITPTNACYMKAYMFFTNAQSSMPEGWCINLSWDGERDGEYEEYVEHVYELDPDLELRGIPKLTAGNDLYYDGDVYEPDGTVTRKYGVVDLGSLEWGYNSTYGYGAVSIESIKQISVSDANKLQIVCAKYPTISARYDSSMGTTDDKTICQGIGDNRIKVKDSAYTTAPAFKTAMSGVYLVYELATPTEESADPYNGTQIVDDFGTEEFIDAGVEAGDRDVAIPVGHVTLYQPNLRAKLEMVPEAPEDEGYYVVYHHDGINEYVPLIIPQELPNLPTEDGTYTLKCTVASGSATLSFESEV